MLLTKKTGWSGFTLIELLIVVAIIAILAAIAVPNFLEAQTRSKVSRTAADMRSITTAIESYAVDNNRYPETDTGVTNIAQLGVGMIRLTTPLAYLTSIPGSPFLEKNIGSPSGQPKNATRDGYYLYVGARHIPGFSTDNAPQDLKDDNYNADRAAYLGYGVPALNLAVRSQGDWLLKSVGPNNIDDRNSAARPGLTPADARPYDPTNGTVSDGDIVVFNDFGNARRN